ncbi:NAD(P)H-dependent oxidoreductase [Peptococcaceae bacterium 1198_IL3148]
MGKILFIKANPKPDEHSNTFKLANVFLQEYIKYHPKDEKEITTLDLYQLGIRLLDGEMIAAKFSGQHNEVHAYAQQFAAAEKYIIAAPMWNLSIPAILKAYFDYVVQVGITFKYTENGPVGLLTDKPRKAVHIVSRGGMYSEGPAAQYEMGDRYVRTILNFMGIPHVETIKLELADVLQGEALAAAQEKAYYEARDLAKVF